MLSYCLLSTVYFFPFIIPHSSFIICSFLACAVLDVDVVALDHAFERLAVNAEDARGVLLVAARVREDARDVAPLDLGERGPFFARGRQVRLGGGRLFFLLRRSVVAHALRQVFGPHDVAAQGDGTHHSVLKLAHVAGPCVLFEKVGDRKSTRLNSSHDQISYAVFCLKKKKKYQTLCIDMTLVYRKART